MSIMAIDHDFAEKNNHGDEDFAEKNARRYDL